MVQSAREYIVSYGTIGYLKNGYAICWNLISQYMENYVQNLQGHTFCEWRAICSFYKIIMVKMCFMHTSKIHKTSLSNKTFTKSIVHKLPYQLICSSMPANLFNR